MLRSSAAADGGRCVQSRDQEQLAHSVAILGRRGRRPLLNRTNLGNARR